MSGRTQFISGVSATSGSSQVVGTVQGSVYFGDNENSPLNRLPYAEEALFNSFNKRHETCCLTGTRVDLLQEIYAWAEGYNEQFIFWLNGLAGTGKSTIARTVARKYFDNGQLGASFFFSRGGGDVGHAGKFFTTIALQLSTKSQSLQRHICDALRKNNNIATQSLGDQWRQLVLEPLSKSSSDSCPPCWVLVIDALDECDNDKDIRTILQLFTEARSLKTVRIRVLLTSRREIPIRHGFYQIAETEHQDFVLHNISPSIVDHDIAIYLEHNLGLIRDERSLSSSWPGEKAIGRLVQNASGLFIWVATVCRFIQEGGWFAPSRLAMILETSSDEITAPEMHLNDIYLAVLRHSISPHYSNNEKNKLYTMLRNILGSVVILTTPMSPHSLSKLLYVSNEEVEQTLGDLHAILEVPKEQTSPLRLHHPSFRDFLLDKNRCDDFNFWVDEKEAHARLARKCIQLMSMTLKEDICDVRKPGTFTDEVEGSQVEQCLPMEIQYACLYWVEHLQKSGLELRDNHDVDQFLRSHFLHWLEALSWMQKISEGILGIMSLESLANVAGCHGLYAFVHDMKRFALHNRAAVEQSPLQLYCSALLFAPATSIVRRQFSNKIPQWIKRGPEVDLNWSETLQIFEGHSGDVFAVAFSPNGKQLATGSSDKTVRFWDAATGAMLQILYGHSSNVNTVAYSADGKKLVSGSFDKTVRVWDTATGVILQIFKPSNYSIRAVAFSPDNRYLTCVYYTGVQSWDVDTGEIVLILEGHLDRINSIAFSPDGKKLASSSSDRTVRVWDMATGATIRILEGHWALAEVIAVVFSPDGNLLASGSNDGIVRFWDLATGGLLQKLEGHSSRVNSVAFSPDGKQLASGASDQTVRVWDMATGAILQILSGHSGSVNAVAFSPNGKQLISGSNTVRVWDLATRATPPRLECHSSYVTDVVFSPDGMLVASSSNDKTVRVWDVATEATIQIFKGHLHYVNDVVFSPDGMLVASSSNDKTVRVWDVATGVTVQIFKGHLNNVNKVVFSPDGKLLASSSSDNTARVWNVATGVSLHIFRGHSNSVRAVAFSPDGKQLATGSSDTTVGIWDLPMEAMPQILKGHSNWVYAVAFSPDGKHLASISRDKTLWVWNVATGASLQIFKFRVAVLSLSYRNDGSIMTDRGRLDVTASHDKIILKSPAPLGPRIFWEDGWIGSGKDRMLWLPPDYRLSCSAIRGNVICLGHLSGRVSIFEFIFPG